MIDEKQAFWELMNGPSDAYKAEVWKARAYELAEKMDKIERAAFDAGFWVWFGPTNIHEEEAGLAILERGWKEYEAQART